MTEKRDLLKDLEICEGATEGPWYARATDDDHYMNARYVGLDAGPGFVHDGVCGMGGDNKSERVIAITLLQAPDLACVQDERWDENATFIAEARLGWPHAITRALAAEARVKELEGRKCETCEQWLQELDGHKWADCRGILRSEGFDLDFADPEPRGQITVRTHKTFACNCWKKRGGE